MLRSKTLLLLLYIVFASYSGYGQTTSDSIVPVSKWEIGIDLLPLVKLNQLPAKSLFFAETTISAKTGVTLFESGWVRIVKTG